MKPLHIPNSKKTTGLVVYCKVCQTNVYETCKRSGKSIFSCQHGNKHFFKVYTHQPGSENKRKTKKLETRNIDEARIEALKFQRQVKENRIEQNQITTSREKIRTKAIPQLLVHALSRYTSYLQGENVPTHLYVERSLAHVKDVEYSFKMLIECLRKNGHDISSFKIDKLDDEIVGQFYQFLLNEKHFGNRSFNKHLSYHTSFINWYTEEFNSPLRNPFEKVKRKRINSNPQSISQEEFQNLLKRITPENGIKEYASGQKPLRSLYRSWIADGFRLALETGRRREEIISLKFNDIVTDRDGSSFIKVEDYKVNRIQHRTNDEEKKMIFIPITEGLQTLLNNLNYEQFKGTNNFILAPELQVKRNRVMRDVLSRGFSHYYSQLNTGKKLTFKDLRKTYITNLSLFMGGNAKAITQHSDDAVIEKYYLDKTALAKAAKGFKVFSDEPERQKELTETRDKAKGNSREMEVSK